MNMDSTNTAEQGLDSGTWEHRRVCVALEIHMSLATGEFRPVSSVFQGRNSS